MLFTQKHLDKSQVYNCVYHLPAKTKEIHPYFNGECEKYEK